MNVLFHNIDNGELRRRLQLAATGEPAPAHDFFSQFEYNVDIANQNILLVNDQIIPLLIKLKQLDSGAYARIHKGDPYYFAAMSSFFLHNFDHAVYFFDAAVSEDIKNDPGSRTPAIMFLEIDGDPLNQAARPLTQNVEDRFTYFVNRYNQLSASIPIALPEIRIKFLSRAVGDKQEWRTLATSLISFLLEADYLPVLQKIRVSDGTWEPFFTHLFKGCVLFESLLKANPYVPVPQGQLGNILNGNGGVKNRLGINRILNSSGPAFANVLADLSGVDNDIEKDLEIVVRLRNTIGHNIGWATPMTSDQYTQLVMKVMNAIIHTISGLY
jgi:hypothetical protein